MTNPLHAKFYADRAVHTRVRVVENVRLARDTFRVRMECPAIARRIVPGQFLMLRLADCNDPLIGRPLALYDTVRDADDEPIGVDVVYLVKGKLTSRLARFVPRQELEVWGPLGNGFSTEPIEHLIMVAGGIGQTPFLALGREFLGRTQYGQPLRKISPAKQVTLCYGARSADLLAGVADFEAAGIDVRIATDDGSRGRRGFVTELLRDALSETKSPRRIACCGPEIMMEAVAQVARETNTVCEVSLETPMACGVGICFTCVAKIRDAAGNWDYKRTCVDGPVFDAATVEW